MHIPIYFRFYKFRGFQDLRFPKVKYVLRIQADVKRRASCAVQRLSGLLCILEKRKQDLLRIIKEKQASILGQRISAADIFLHLKFSSSFANGDHSSTPQTWFSDSRRELILEKNIELSPCKGFQSDNNRIFTTDRLSRPMKSFSSFKVLCGCSLPYSGVYRHKTAENIATLVR